MRLLWSIEPHFCDSLRPIGSGLRIARPLCFWWNQTKSDSSSHCLQTWLSLSSQITITLIVFFSCAQVFFCFFAFTFDSGFFDRAVSQCFRFFLLSRQNTAKVSDALSDHRAIVVCGVTCLLFPISPSLPMHRRDSCSIVMCSAIGSNCNRCTVLLVFFGTLCQLLAHYIGHCHLPCSTSVVSLSASFSLCRCH